ncbi:MAG: hypothetical protein ACE1S7_02485 [Candidatus Tisiphia sp.]
MHYNFIKNLLSGTKIFAKIVVLCSLLNFTIIHNSYAEEPKQKDTLDTIINILSGF